MFKVYLGKKWLVVLSESDFERFQSAANKLNADEEYRLWMNKRYAEFKSISLEILGNSGVEVKRNKHSHVIKVTW